jgi:Sulfotransferase domain
MKFQMILSDVQAMPLRHPSQPVPLRALLTPAAAWRALNVGAYWTGLKSPNGMPLPDFLGIGAQKAATSWLSQNLRAHPQVFMPDLAKELHFFDNHLIDYGLERYSQLFAAGGQRVKGEVTPTYGILPPRRIRFIGRLMPRLKIIFLMRNPIDRAWSHARMDLAREPGRQPEAPEFMAHFYGAASRRRGDYETILRNWRAYFPADQMLVRFFEDVAGHPRRLLTEVFSFLGLSTDVDWSQFPYQDVIFKGPDLPLPAVLRQTLLRIYKEPIRRLAANYAVPAERWLAE